MIFKNYLGSLLSIPKKFVLLSFALISLFYFVSIFSSCHPPGGGGSNDPCLNANLEFGSVELTLKKSFNIPEIRLPDYPPPQYPNMWTGNPSAVVYPTNGLHGEYYCEVRITSPDCPNFHEEYVWDTNQDKMIISAPSNVAFQVQVVDFEVCGEFYKNSYNVYYETEWNWLSPIYVHFPINITTTTFSYKGRKVCS